MYNFKTVAPYLSNPLVLIGFSLFVLVGLFTTIIKSGIVPDLTKKAKKEMINRILLYGFIVSIFVIVSGFVTNTLGLFVKPQPLPQSAEAPLIPTTDLIPFNVGWVFVGYYNLESEMFVDGNYLQLVYRTDITKKDQKTPIIGDVYQVTKERNVIIKNYKTDGLRNQFVSPVATLNKPSDTVSILTDEDYTGVLIPKNTLVIINEAVIGKRSPNGLHAVWVLIRVCHVDDISCQEAVKALEKKEE